MPEYQFQPVDQKNVVEHFPSAVEVNKNSKGYTWSIKLRCRDGEESELLRRIVELDREIRVKFNHD